MTDQQIAIVERILQEWHEAAREHFEKVYTNLDYDSEHYRKVYKVGEKYVRLDQGGSGYYMIEIATGNVYAIKAYGVPNKKKIVGDAWADHFNGAQLEDAKGIRGSYDNRPHVWKANAPGLADRESVCPSCGRQMIRITTAMVYKCRVCDHVLFEVAGLN